MERNAEMEDVLSSIRRLVSEEVRTQEPLAEIKEPKTGLSANAVSADRLVLSPALRVLPDVEAEAPSESDGVLQLTDMEMRDLNDLPPATPDDLRAAADVLSTDDFAVETVLPDEDVAQANARLVSLEDTIAELESVVSEQNIEFEPDGSEEVGSSPEVERLDWVPRFVHGGQKPEADTAELAQPEAELPAEATEEVLSEPELDDTVAALVEESEEAVPEEDTLHAAPENDSEVASKDEATDETQAQFEEPEAPVEQAEAEPQSLAFEKPSAAVPEGADAEDDAFILDEDALRDLVRDLVREELQGVLGERITRNVRKLVRTEINRVLASQDFE